MSDVRHLIIGTTVTTVLTATTMRTVTAATTTTTVRTATTVSTATTVTRYSSERVKKNLQKRILSKLTIRWRV